MLPQFLPNDETKISCEASNRVSPKASTTTNINKKPTEYFLGFKDASSKLEELWYRWKALEDWIELAVRPRNCHPEDRWLLKSNGSVNHDEDDNNEHDDEDDYIDDLEALKNQCSLVQNLFNEHLFALPIETTRWESSLVVQPSQIPGAGMGLYYQPLAKSQEDEEKQQQQQQQKEKTLDEATTTSAVLPSGSLICYYTGQVHTHSSASALGDQSYLLWIRDNTLVDPRPLSHISARYANDPLNDALVNCAFVPTAISSRVPNANGPSTDYKDIPPKPHPDTIRTSVVATRDILPGEELFVSYGEIYWNQQPIVGNRLVLHGNTSSNSDSSNNHEEKVRDDPEEDVDDEEDFDDETFPFSPLFQNKLLAKPILWENATTE